MLRGILQGSKASLQELTEISQILRDVHTLDEKQWLRICALASRVGNFGTGKGSSTAPNRIRDDGQSGPLSVSDSLTNPAGDGVDIKSPHFGQIPFSEAMLPESAEGDEDLIDAEERHQEAGSSVAGNFANAD